MPKASKELMKVKTALMSQNPELLLELGSHTDSGEKMITILSFLKKEPGPLWIIL